MRSLSSGRIIKSPPVRKDFRLLHSPDPAKILSRYLEERAEPVKEEAPKEEENSAETGQREERDFQAEAEKILAEAEATLTGPGRKPPPYWKKPGLKRTNCEKKRRKNGRKPGRKPITPVLTKGWPRGEKKRRPNTKKS